jgi:thioredoxin reductase
MKVEDVVIIGAGPAGIAAAIQLKRSGFDPLLLEKNQAGGLLKNANMVDNYPGFPGGIRGTALAGLFEKHLARAGVKVHHEEVRQLDFNEEFFVTTTVREIRARVAVVASGTKPKSVTAPEVPAEASGRVFTEVYPVLGARSCRAAVIGAGDAAFDYALNLARNNKVYVLNRGDKRRCLPLLWEKASAEKNIEYHENTFVNAIRAGGGALGLFCGRGRSTWELPVDYVIFATGRVKNTNFLSGGLLDQAFDLEGAGLLYFVGDVKNDIFRQSSIAVGDGISAAMRIEKKLRGSG